MGFRFIGQPFKDAEQIGLIISAALRDEANDRAWIATAWGKRSGLSRLAADITAFRKRGGHIEAIVGVDEGGATVEGLRLAEQLFDAAYVFHDPGARTFHPKIYAVQNDASAVAVVGSGNLTRGGLYTNYEGSVAADLDLTDADERAFLDSVRAYYDRIAGLSDVCKPLDTQAIEDLINDPSVVVVSEKQANQRRAAQRGKGTSGMFGGKAVPDLAGAPPPSLEPLPAEEEDDDTVVSEPRRATARPARVWWKQLSRSDAHRKAAGSHQRARVTLNKAGHEIEFRTWFRDELFGDLSWTEERLRTGGIQEVTIVPFEVFIDGTHAGRYSMRVDHAASRISDQGNTPTYLNWSGLLPEIKANDYRDWWLELARMPDDTYRLSLTPTEPSY